MNVDALKNNQCVFERILTTNDSLKTPFEELIGSLKFLYGASSVVEFNIK